MGSKQRQVALRFKASLPRASAQARSLLQPLASAELPQLRLAASLTQLLLQQRRGRGAGRLQEECLEGFRRLEGHGNKVRPLSCGGPKELDMRHHDRMISMIKG